MNEVFTQIIIWIAAAALIFLAGFFCYWMIRERQQTKAEYYATSYPNYPDDPTGLQMPFTVGKQKKKEAPLTKAERSCRKVLSKLRGSSPWHQAIRDTLHQGGNEDFRKLIRQLKSEAEPAPDQMEKILGPDAYISVMVL
jgi:hypothetical protein